MWVYGGKFFEGRREMYRIDASTKKSYITRLGLRILLTYKKLSGLVTLKNVPS